MLTVRHYKMVNIVVSLTLMATAILVAVDASNDLTIDNVDPVFHSTLRSLEAKKDAAARKLGSDDGKCDSCPHHTFYQYVEDKSDFHAAAIDKRLKFCSIAAITSEEELYAAAYAIPTGKVAITQGFFPVDDQFHDCHFEDSKSDDCVITACHDHFPSYFKNLEDSDVFDDGKCWDFKYDIPCSATWAAVGSDQFLRPVQIWNKGASADDKYAYDGFIYECCPDFESTCGFEVEEEER